MAVTLPLTTHCFGEGRLFTHDQHTSWWFCRNCNAQDVQCAAGSPVGPSVTGPVSRSGCARHTPRVCHMARAGLLHRQPQLQATQQKQRCSQPNGSMSSLWLPAATSHLTLIEPLRLLGRLLHPKNPTCHHPFTAQWWWCSSPQDGVSCIKIVRSCTCAWLLPMQSLLDLGLLSPPACMVDSSRRAERGTAVLRSRELLARQCKVAVVSMNV